MVSLTPSPRAACWMAHTALEKDGDGSGGGGVMLNS